MTFPALREAPTDESLKGTDIRIYLFLINDVLDFRDWRTFKQVFVAKNVDVPQSSVSDALERLVKAGYLERRLHSDGDAQYRLVYSRRPSSTASEN